MNEFDLQLFADSGTNVTTTTGTANAYTGDTAAGDGMSPGMKTFYNTQLLENARHKMVFTQLGKKQVLPLNHGKSVEWRKWNTFDRALEPLTEGVIPTGKSFGGTNLSVSVQQFGDYAAISDVLDMHHVDNVLVGCAEEMSDAAAWTLDTLTRNVLVAGTNVMYAPKGDTEITSRGDLTAECKLTADVVHKAATWLKKCKAPKFEGGAYVAVIHPSVAYDLTSSEEWMDIHKYAATTEIFDGEIGKLRGVRFIESTEAPVIDNGTTKVYATLFFGKGAFGVVDPEGMGMEMIIKDRGEVGGPLEQFSTVGWKAETAAKILYQERMVRVESGSFYSDVDEVN